MLRSHEDSTVGVLLAIARSMAQNPTHASGRDTVVIIGGKGGLAAHYREAVEQNGFNFRYYEDRVPSKLGVGGKTIVIVIVSMVSHPLMTRARDLAGDNGRIVYLKRPSVSAVRETIAKRAPASLALRGAA